MIRNDRYPHVFQPLTVRGLTLKNRLEYAPTVVLKCSPEGEVFWLPRERLPEYPLVEDFMDMLNVFESDTLNEFQYYQENSGEWGLRLL